MMDTNFDTMDTKIDTKINTMMDANFDRIERFMTKKFADKEITTKENRMKKTLRVVIPCGCLLIYYIKHTKIPSSQDHQNSKTHFFSIAVNKRI